MDRTWARVAQEGEEYREQLRTELGREPTEDEFIQAYVKHQGLDWPDTT